MSELAILPPGTPLLTSSPFLTLPQVARRLEVPPAAITLALYAGTFPIPVMRRDCVDCCRAVDVDGYLAGRADRQRLCLVRRPATKGAAA